MPPTLETLTWHPLPPSLTFPHRRWAWIPGNTGKDNRDGTLCVEQQRVPNGKVKRDQYGVEEHFAVGVPVPGHEFLVVSDTDPLQPDAYLVFVADASESRDRCTCRAMVCRGIRCKHLEAIRSLTTPHGGSREQSLCDGA